MAQLFAELFEDLSDAFISKDDDTTVLSDVELEDAYIQPEGMLGFNGDQKPWDLRDRFRQLAVDLNPMFVMREDSEQTFEQVLTGYTLASKTVEVGGPKHLLSLYEAHHPMFRGKPEDILTVLRPAGEADPRDSFIRFEGVPAVHSEVRAAKFFWTTCEGFTRFAYQKKTTFTDEAELALERPNKEELDVRPWRLDSLHKDLVRNVLAVERPTLEPPDYRFELKIMYCMRQHTIHKTYKEFLALNDWLAVEVLLMPGFPEVSVPERLFDPKALGIALAEYLSRMHHSLAARGVFSPRLMDFCMVDVHRVHIEEEMRVTKLLGDNVLKGTYWQVVDEKWLVKWRRFVSGRGARRYLPPCAITNENLLHWERQGRPGTAAVKRASPDADLDYDAKLAVRREWREAFKLVDEDIDGTITTTALGTVMRALGKNPSQAELADLINQVDADGNGTVSFDEFESLMAKLRATAGQDWDEIEACFQIFDKEGTGTVNFAELRHDVCNTGESLDSVEFNALGVEKYVDRDGLLNYEDLVKTLRQRDLQRRQVSTGKKDPGTWRQVPNSHLALVTDYRVVNYNVWTFWVRVHGGGPPVTRKGREVYSEPAKSRLQGVLELQCWARQNQAREKLDQAFLKDFTHSAKGCRAALTQHLVKTVVADGSEQVKAYLRRDNDKRLHKHARFAIGVWRKKKGFTSMDSSLARLKAEQTIFSRSSGKLEEAAEGQPLVVEEQMPVIMVGSAEEYEVTLPEEKGLEFMKKAKLRKHSASEMTYLANIPEGFDARLKSTNPRLAVHHNSVLVSVNGFPVSSLTFSATIERITSTRWPLVMRWRRPINLTECFSLIEIATNVNGDPLKREETEWRRGGIHGTDTGEQQEEQNRLMYEDYVDTWRGSSIVKLQVLKRRLVRGVTVRLHGSPTMGGEPYLTRLYLTETHFFWEEPSRADPTVDRNQVASGVTLYELKFLTLGKTSESFKKAESAKKVLSGMCFSLHFEYDGGAGCLDCEVSDALPPTGNEEVVRNRIRGAFKKDPGEVRADVLVWGLRKIIEEVQATQLYYDEDGLPKKRRLPKTKLKVLK